MYHYFAEFFGTFLLVFLGCGSAVLGANEMMGVSLAFGLTLLCLVYAIGPVSGCHVNPAVSLLMASLGRISLPNAFVYIVFQCLGAIAAAFLLKYLAIGADLTHVLNGYQELSPKGFSLIACLLTEVIMTTFLLYVVLLASNSHAGLAIGFALIAIHLVSIPVTNTSVNFARSLGVAVAQFNTTALTQLWLFGVAHIISIILAINLYMGALRAKQNVEPMTRRQV